MLVDKAKKLPSTVDKGLVNELPHITRAIYRYVMNWHLSLELRSYLVCSKTSIVKPSRPLYQTTCFCTFPHNVQVFWLEYCLFPSLNKNIMISLLAPASAGAKSKRHYILRHMLFGPYIKSENGYTYTSSSLKYLEDRATTSKQHHTIRLTVDKLA